MKRSIINVLVGILNGVYSKPCLLIVRYYDCPVDHSIMSQVLNDACMRLWPDGIQYDKVELIITDAASYMKKAFNSNPLFTRAIHITCLAHAIHNLCDTIRLKYGLVNTFVSEVKNRISYSKVDRIELVEKVGFLPPKSVITRWGTFLEAAEYHLNFIEQLKSWIMEMESASVSASVLKELIQNPEFDLQLIAIKKCFFLVTCIKKIETQGLSIHDQFKVLMDIKQHPLLPEWAKQRFTDILQKNEGLTKLQFYYNSDEDLAFNNRVQYAPLVSADVERSFSQYKYLLSERRTNLSVENIEMLNIVMFNHFNVITSDADGEESEDNLSQVNLN